MAEEKIKLADAHLVAANYYIAHGFKSKRMAMRAASYSEGTAVSTVFERDDVTRYVERAKLRALRRAELSKDWVLGELQDVVSGANDITELIEIEEDGTFRLDVSNMTPKIRKAIASFKIEQTEKVDDEGNVVARFIKFEPKVHDKLGALAQISRVLGLNTERLEISGAALVQELQEGRARARLANATPEKPADGD